MPQLMTDDLTAIGFHDRGDFLLSPESSQYAGNIVRICFEPHLGCDGWSIAEVVEQEGTIEIAKSVHIPETQSDHQIRPLAQASGITLSA